MLHLMTPARTTAIGGGTSSQSTDRPRRFQRQTDLSLRPVPRRFLRRGNSVHDSPSRCPSCLPRNAIQWFTRTKDTTRSKLSCVKSESVLIECTKPRVIKLATCQLIPSLSPASGTAKSSLGRQKVGDSTLVKHGIGCPRYVAANSVSSARYRRSSLTFSSDTPSRSDNALAS